MTKGSPAEPVSLNGPQIRAAFVTAATWLERHADRINALNVFPVPDGDTGLNMSLTLRAAADAALVCGADGAPRVLDALARGALMGARGNSGVILAQFLRGLARAHPLNGALTGAWLAEALAAGADAAYRAVAEPVEGTILTVARSAAEAALARADGGGATPVEVLDAAHSAARLAVERTPEQLAVLREAGVVDAGGEGFRLVLQGLLAHLSGESLLEPDATPRGRVGPTSIHQADAFGYCTEVLFRPNGGGRRHVRERIRALGTSVLVVGDDELIRVHVHTLRPGAVLDLATELGEIVQVKVDNMRLQSQAFRDRLEAPPSLVEPGTAIIAVAMGHGFQEIFRSLGAIVVTGGQGMNPAVGDLLDAIERAPRQHVVVLPNNPNILLAAEQAAAAAHGPSVTVVPTRSMPQGIAALLTMCPDGETPPDLEAATRAAQRCQTIHVTRAVRQTEVDGTLVLPGSWVAVLDDRLIAGGGSLEALVERALDALPPGAYEIATVYIGADGTDDDAAAIGQTILRRTGIAVEVQRGGQPHYPYILSVE